MGDGYDDLDGGLPPGGLADEEPEPVQESEPEEAALDDEACFEVFDEDGYPVCQEDETAEGLPPAEGREASPEETCTSCPERRIDRVWTWLSGDIVQQGYSTDPDRDPPAALQPLVERCCDLGVTDVVLTLNGQREETEVTWVRGYDNEGSVFSRRARDLYQAFSGAGIAVHYMIFVIPVVEFVEQAAAQAAALSRRFRPRSIHFDAENAWLRYDGPGEDYAGALAAIHSGFVRDWPCDRPALGMGVTIAALSRGEEARLPGSLVEMMSGLDFAIPQMYGSFSTYRRGCEDIRACVERHYALCKSALGSTEEGAPKKVIVGQTSVTSKLLEGAPASATGRARARRRAAVQRMQDMLDAVITLGEEPPDYVREISYWSSRHLHPDSGRRAFVTHVAGLAPAGNLRPGFAPPSGVTRRCVFPE